MSNFDTMFGALSFLFALVSLILSFSNGCEIDEDNIFNVIDYGATSDGYTDNSKAFLEAWDAACSSLIDSPRVYVPPDGTFLLNPVTFQGPCNALRISFVISGVLVAPDSPSLWDGMDASQWLGFTDINGLRLDGFGYIDGQGQSWWDQSCKYHPELRHCTKVAPTALKFLGCKDSSVSNLNFINSAQTHILVRGCNTFGIQNVIIQSPGNSPNTDGIHIQSSQQVIISDSRISCGDDCISIGDHISDIEINRIECGPGHGISIGSLGKRGNYVQVEKIHVADAFLNGTSNGARIKSWQVGRGYVRDVTFENLRFNHVKNPLIIDQNYCNIRGKCKERETGVQISNVIYKDIVGTSSTDIAINFNCSKSVACFGISMESVYLSSAKIGKQVTAYCNNAYGEETDVVPGPCLIAE
ncbi:pectin lyase-like superfamily protein [Striga asiatica]|uniref:endo-polygalacturonase n=1 Tax=Striga asiatica TaxID=4170 RepID=A0A5A7PQ80_STRAF|nr:pectin lyase-like superfamily protein [Striga asiatica]